MSNLKSVAEALAEIRAFSQYATYTDAEAIAAATPQYHRQWDDVVGQAVNLGELIIKDGTKFLVQQSHVASDNYPPDGDGALALFQAFRGPDLQAWMAGEYTVAGYQRSYDGVDYVAIQDAGANTFIPDQVPAIWAVLEVDDVH